jgi:hypothetical protein
MARSYYLSSTASDLTGGADFSRALVAASSALVTQSILIAASATETSYGFTAVGDPGIDGDNGEFTVNLHVTTASNNITGSASVSRIDSAGTVQATSSVSAGQSLGTTGTKSFVLSGVDLGTWGTGDRLRVNYIFANSSTMGLSFAMGQNTINSEVITPFADRIFRENWGELIL